MIQSIETYVEAACKNSSNVFGEAFFAEHIQLMRSFSNRLAEKLGADKEIVELSAVLHDISAIGDFNALARHAQLGAEIAGGILRQAAYDPKKIVLVKECIEKHSIPLKAGEASIEAVCISNADAMSQIVNPKYWLYYAFSVRHFGFEEGVNWYRQRIESHWNALIPEAKSLIEEIYLKVKAFM